MLFLEPPIREDQISAGELAFLTALVGPLVTALVGLFVGYALAISGKRKWTRGDLNP